MCSIVFGVHTYTIQRSFCFYPKDWGSIIVQDVGIFFSRKQSVKPRRLP